jgi:hypothetical protein
MADIIAGINSEIISMNNESRIDFLSNSINEFIDKILTCHTKEQRLYYEKITDSIKILYENEIDKIDKEQDIWEGYPSLMDRDFNEKIFNKKEFRDLTIPVQKISDFLEKPKEFTLHNTQKFISKYMSPYTPYNGILLWHGVGIGKTCAAISSAEKYRKDGGILSRNKIVVLLPSTTLFQNWKDNIFNLKDYLANTDKTKNVLCTGSTFIDELGINDEMTYEKKEKRVNQMIKKYYEFYGFLSFANKIEREINAESNDRDDREYLKLQVIRKNYSNRIFIVDEVHFTRDYAIASSTNDQASKKIAEYLDLIARYGENNKFILASATPMYNKPVEIIDILNILLLNDKRPPIESSDIFKSDGYELKNDQSIQLLIRKSAGYISFIRGENPVVFPIKIYPHLPGMSYIPNPTYDLSGEIIPIDKKIQNITFIKSPMSNLPHGQYYVYHQITEPDDEKKDNFGNPSSMASIITFPINKENAADPIQIEKLYSDIGFDETFAKDGERYIYKPHAIINGIPFLQNIPTYLDKYSSKYSNLLNIVNNSTGKVFIFSRFIKAGILTLALMLEQNGYIHYTEKGITPLLKNRIPEEQKRCYCGKLKNDEIHTNQEGLAYHLFSQGKFILFIGKTSKDSLNILKDEFNGKLKGKSINLYGENIKFVLGTTVIEQGISFHNVREVHIIDPWYHLNRSEQVVGRAIRNFSHISLPPSMRNVSVYLYTATIPEDLMSNKETYVESMDERTYRIAYYKSKKIANINRILKSNAVDCLLNKNGNQLTVSYFGNQQLDVITSQSIRLKDRFLGDLDNDIICDYNTCEYNCIGEKPDTIISSESANLDTYRDILSLEDLVESKKFIMSLFQKKNSYTITEIIDIMISTKPQIGVDFIYLAINSMIYFKDTILNQYGLYGYILYVEPYYIFQMTQKNPTEFSHNINHESLYVRDIPLTNRVQLIDIEGFDLRDFKQKPVISDNIDLMEFINRFNDYISIVKSRYLSMDHIYGRIARYKDLISKIIKNETSKAAAEISNAEYLRVFVDTPVIMDLIEQYFIFGQIDRLNYDNKVNLLKFILQENIKRNGLFLNPSDKYYLLEKMTFRFFGKKGTSDRRYNIIYKYELESQGYHQPDAFIPVMFRIYNEIDRTTHFYDYNRISQLIDRTYSGNVDSIYKKFKYDYSLLEYTRNDKIFGFLSKKKTENDDGTVDFYYANKIFYNFDQKKPGVLDKSEPKGAKCGTSDDNKDIYKIFKYILGEADIERPTSYDDFFLPKFINKISKHTTLWKLEENIKSGSLCEFLEIILRHKQFVDLNTKWFYTQEEKSYMTQFEQDQKEQQILEDQQKKEVSGRKRKAVGSS